MNIEPQTGGGGWMSGPMTTVPHRDLPDVQAAMDELATIAARSDEAADRRPRYNPVAAAILADMRLAGIDVPDLSPLEHELAVLRAVETLRAMGVAADRPDDSRPLGRANRRSI